MDCPKIKTWRQEAGFHFYQQKMAENKFYYPDQKHFWCVII